MPRPDFKTTTGEDRVPLHLNITKSQSDFLATMSERTGMTKAVIVRSALDYAKENSSTVGIKPVQ